MGALRSALGFAAAGTAGVLASGTVAAAMLHTFVWLTENAVIEGNGWGIALVVARAALIPVMLFVVIRMAWRAAKILMKRRGAMPASATSAIVYCGVVAAYISLGMFAPIFWVAVPALIEPILYPLAALFLLVATIRVIWVDGQLPGRAVVSPKMSTILVTVAWAAVIGASVAYAQAVMARESMECWGGECPPERTLAAVGFMLAATTAAAAMVARGPRSRLGITSAVAFACLALLFPITIIPTFVMPYDAFVPSFFYGLAAVAFLIASVARKNDGALP